MTKSLNPFARFTAADEDSVKQRLVWAAHGEVGTRKTTFGLEAPGPIVVFSLDQGLEGVINRVLKTYREEHDAKKAIYVKEYAWSPGQFGDDNEAAQAAASDLRDELSADYEHALTVARTILWDKETNIWELFRYAEFGAPNDAPGITPS